MTINAAKTKTMLYTYRVGLRLNGVFVKGQELEAVNTYKYLGILLDEDLSFKKEFNKTISRINHKIWMLGHFRSCLDDPTSITLLKTMLLPYMDNSNLFSQASHFMIKKGCKFSRILP